MNTLSVVSLTLAVFTLSPIVINARDLSGSVVSVLEGDTLAVLHNTRPERIRLSGIDCPEKGQAFSNRAKHAMSALVLGKDVVIQTHGQDNHGRTLADVRVPDGTHINHELVKHGWCWWNQKDAPKDRVLRQLEHEARTHKKGLWSEPHPVPPWLYRRLRAGAYP